MKEIYKHKNPCGIFMSVVFLYLTASVSFASDRDLLLGRAMFKRLWVTAPSSTQAADGLGPLYNARACSVCHKNGRKSTVKGGKYPRLLYRLNKDPIYGNQLQPFAIPSLLGEGTVAVSYFEKKVVLPDGEIVFLRTPKYTILTLNYGPLAQSHAISPRAAPTLRGVGLLGAIATADILRKEDREDKNKDGISGRAHRVENLHTGRIQIGRFGWKATQPTVRQQSAIALSTDIGISSPLLPKGSGECTKRQQKCLQLPDGNSPQYENLELPSVLENAMLRYVLSLGTDTPTVKVENNWAKKRGKELFTRLGCQQCHTPKYTVDGRDIYPYTDLLLHDMGRGLADTVREGDAAGSEWKTPALWGIAKMSRAQQPYYLHDGRARTVQEAILWHGGEASKSVEAYKNLPRKQRETLQNFIKGL